MGGISAFFNFIKRFLNGNIKRISDFFMFKAKEYLYKAVIHFIIMLMYAFVFLVFISLFKSFVTLIEFILDLYDLFFKVVKSDINGNNYIAPNPFLILFKNLVLPAFLFFVKVFFPIYLLIFQSAILGYLYRIAEHVFKLYKSLLNNYIPSVPKGLLDKRFHL